MRRTISMLRLLLKNYIAGYRHGRAEAKLEGALDGLTRANARYDEARMAVAGAKNDHIAALMEAGMSYEEACAELDVQPSPVGTLLADCAIREAIQRGLYRWAQGSK